MCYAETLRITCIRQKLYEIHSVYMLTAKPSDSPQGQSLIQRRNTAQNARRSLREEQLSFENTCFTSELGGQETAIRADHDSME